MSRIEREYRRAVELERAIYSVAMVLRHRELMGDLFTAVTAKPPATMPECPRCGWPRTIGRFHDPELPDVPAPHELPE